MQGTKSKYHLSFGAGKIEPLVAPKPKQHLTFHRLKSGSENDSRNGLVASSSASVVGSVGLPSARSFSTLAARSFSAELVGSTMSAKRASR